MAGTSHPGRAHGLNQRSSLIQIVSLHHSAIPLGGIDRVGRIASEQFPLHSLPEGLLKDAVHVRDRLRR
jgi:hypothetical protein